MAALSKAQGLATPGRGNAYDEADEAAVETALEEPTAAR